MDHVDENDRLIRWEDLRRRQLSYLINIIMIFSIGALGFESSLLLNNNQPPGWSDRLQTLLLMSLVLLAIAFTAGMIATVARLCDFRVTANKIRLEINTPEHPDLSRMKLRADVFGTITWGCLWCQIVMFGLAVLLLSLVTFTAGLR